MCVKKNPATKALATVIFLNMKYFIILSLISTGLKYQIKAADIKKYWDKLKNFLI
jgi:hypothetical protein